MKLLIVTQAVDREDPVLGFFARWIEEFARRAEAVEVIALREGAHRLPENVRVYSLGKKSAPRGTMIYHSTARRARYAWRFLLLAWRLRGRYDAVFVHMNPEYVALGGALWRALGKPVGLWYVHRSRTAALWLAALLSDFIFTSARRSFPFPSAKVSVLGHGIEVERFAATPRALDASAPSIVSLGRITPIKRLETVIEAVRLLREGGVEARLELVGAPAAGADAAYEETLRARVARAGLSSAVSFTGAVPPEAVPAALARADLSVNACPTGGVDKAVLESLVAGVPAFVANESFRDFYGAWFPRFHFPEGDAAALASRIEAFLGSADAAAVREALARRVRARADLRALIAAIMERYERAN